MLFQEVQISIKSSLRSPTVDPQQARGGKSHSGLVPRRVPPFNGRLNLPPGMAVQLGLLGSPFPGHFSHRFFDLHFERFFKVFGTKFGSFFHVFSPSLNHVFEQIFTRFFIGLLIAFRRDSFQATRILLHEYNGLRTVTSCRELYFLIERPQIRTSFLTLIQTEFN